VFKQAEYIGYLDRYAIFVPAIEGHKFPFETKAYKLDSEVVVVLFCLRLGAGFVFIGVIITLAWQWLPRREGRRGRSRRAQS
jgi:hypothetical protein